MIRLQGKYRLTFPVTPGEIQFRGFGNETETTTSIVLTSKTRPTGRRPKVVSFDFVLPGDPTADYIEVEGYQGPRPWLAGLDRLSGSEVLLTIDELDLAWNVIVGPCDGRFVGRNVDFHGTIELPLFIKEEFITWTNSKTLLEVSKIIGQMSKKRPNTSGKKAKKTTTTGSLVSQAIQAEQKRRIESKLAAFRASRLS